MRNVIADFGEGYVGVGYDDGEEAIEKIADVTRDDAEDAVASC